jgi:hypothetical protein
MNLPRQQRVVVLLASAFAIAISSIAVTSASAKPGDDFLAPYVAKRAASQYVRNLGLEYAIKTWKAECRNKGRKWNCDVETVTGQCAGTVRVIKRRAGILEAYKRRIACAD